MQQKRDGVTCVVLVQNPSCLHTAITKTSSYSFLKMQSLRPSAFLKKYILLYSFVHFCLKMLKKRLFLQAFFQTLVNIRIYSSLCYLSGTDVWGVGRVSSTIIFLLKKFELSSPKCPKLELHLTTFFISVVVWMSVLKEYEEVRCCFQTKCSSLLKF